MKISVSGEIREAERRLALGPLVVRRLTQNHEVLAEHASSLYARNVEAPLRLMVNGEGKIAPDLDNEVFAGACIKHSVGMVHDGTKATKNVAQGR